MKLNRVLLLFFISIMIGSSTLYANNQEVKITKIGEYATGALYYNIQVEENYLYFTEFDTKMFCILDIENPSEPISLANYSVTDGHDFEVRNNVAFLSSWEFGIEIVDISEPTNPTKISEYTAGSISHLNIIDDYIYAHRITENRSFYEIIDISNLSEPTKIKEFCEGQGSKPWIENNIALMCVKNLTTLDCYFRAYDIHDRENPILLSEYISHENIFCYGIYKEGNYAYYALAGMGVMIMDYTDIENPIQVTRFENDNNIWRVNAVEDILFITNDRNGTKIFDVKDKNNPIELASFYDGGSAYSLDIKDNLIFVADENDAIEVLEVKGLEIFETSFFLISVLLIIPIISIIKTKSKKL